jgi:uncharacterized repeat protein (TIGR01451 family)
MRRHSLVTGAGLTAGAVFGIVPAAQATDFTVSNLSDGTAPGPAGSLRKAITDANANPGADRILFDSSLTGNVGLTSGSLPITEALEVQGPGADELGIDAYVSNTRIFYINPTVAGDPVTISGLSMSYGHTTGSGGAIVNVDSKLTVEDAFLYANSSSFSGIGGGAIEDSGAYANGSQTTIRNTTITGNAASNGSGGGLGGFMQIGNVINSTIAHNYAYNYGGGVFSNDNGADFENSTIAGNYSYNGGGGVLNGTGGPHTTFLNSIVGDNTAHVSGADLVGSDPFDADFSLIENATGVTLNSSITGSNVVGSDPKLPYYLAFNGGPTPTLLPHFDSPVIDQGKTAGGETTDQRGFARPLDLPLPDFPNSAATGADGADMGAVEVTEEETIAADLTLQITDSPDPVTVGDPLNYAFKVTNHGPDPATGVLLTQLIPSQLSLSAVSGNCEVLSTDPEYGTYVGCGLGSIASGASKTQNLTGTTLASAASVPYISAYGFSDADQIDPNPYDNSAYADTTVQRSSTTSPPAPPIATPPSRNNVAAAIRRCKKKFHGKKRKKCIKKAKRKAGVSVQRRSSAAPPVHPFTERPRPRGIEPLPLRSRINPLDDRD